MKITYPLAPLRNEKRKRNQIKEKTFYGKNISRTQEQLTAQSYHSLFKVKSENKNGHRVFVPNLS